MKTYHHLTGLLLSVLLVCSGWTGIVNTKHNMSTSGGGTIKATTEPEVCIFCHIPHQTQRGTPLWNRSMPTSAYTMYNSDYLRRMNYPVPTLLSSTTGEPGALSRQCLSCHDGTVAVGSVYMVRGTLLGSNQISMSGVNGDGTMPSSATGYIGTDLRVHHPVGIEYNHAITKNFGTGSRGMELLVTPGSAIKLYTYNGKQYVECSSCHDPHTETTKFLRYSSGGSHGANVYGTCISCHEKTNWTTGAHATVNNTYIDTTVSTTYGTNTVSSLGCVNCHIPHKGGGKPYLLRKVEENTCFQGAGSGTTSTVPCHGTGGAKDVQSLFLRTYKHPVTDLTKEGQHSNLDVLYGTGVPSDGGTGVTWALNKHAECVDCHNPHQAKAGSHALAGAWYPAVPSNLVSTSGPLTGVTGVEPSWPGRWTQPTTFTTQESSTKEYQICFKCHSYWGLGAATSGVSTHTLTNYGTMKATDQAWEFNPYNRGAHPVVMTTNQMKALGSRYANPIPAAALLAPWNTNVGNQTMMCSDCHGADDEAGGDPKGPHGSSVRFMLKGMYKNWPDGPDGSGTVSPNGRMYTMDDGFRQGAAIYCLNCHVYDGVAVHTTMRQNMNNAHCVNCHVAVPHGSPTSRLIGYASMPEPYNYNLGGNLQLRGSGYKWNTNNTKTDFYSTHADCNNCHGSNAGGYDTYP